MDIKKIIIQSLIINLLTFVSGFLIGLCILDQVLLLSLVGLSNILVIAGAIVVITCKQKQKLVHIIGIWLCLTVMSLVNIPLFGFQFKEIISGSILVGIISLISYFIGKLINKFL